MDHAWEKSWLTEFFSSIVVQKATSFADTKETVPDDISCDDFLLYMFNSKNGARGTKNLLKSVYDNGIASTAHLDFVGMTQVINNEWKVRNSPKASMIEIGACLCWCLIPSSTEFSC